MADTQAEQVRFTPLAGNGWILMTGCQWNKRVIGLIGLMLAASFSAARAHIDIEPKETIPGRWETFILNVPTETESPTVEVRLSIPEEFEVEAVGHRTDWDM